MSLFTQSDADGDRALRDTLRLAMTPGVGSLLFHRLIERFGSPSAVLAAAGSELHAVEGVGSSVVGELRSGSSDTDVDAQLGLCGKHGIRVLTGASADYPPLLREIPDPPPVLFLKGDLTPADTTSVAIVGSRHATSYGRGQAERLGRALAQTGYTVISGLARGVDAAAHRGALAAGGRTLAVLGNGLSRIYPPEHAELAIEVVQNGALLTESLPGEGPLKTSFPKRNRLISGMSLGVIVVEAAERSGALITARHATEQNREVFAVPGRVDNRMARGCHQLIRDGARLVQSIDDVLEEIESIATLASHTVRSAVTRGAPTANSEPTTYRPVAEKPAVRKLDATERQVYDAVETEATHVDEVIRRSGLAAHVVLATMTTLEVRRLVRRLDGSRWMRVD